MSDIYHFYKSDLDNSSGLWSFQPERFDLCDALKSVPMEKIKWVYLLGSTDEYKSLKDLKNLEEIHIQYPTHEQIEFISSLTQLKRLKVEDYRPKTIDFLKPLINLEELVLKAVSGFDDLMPIAHLKKLRALNLYMLRRVKDYSPLAALTNLQYLQLGSNFDFPQPVADLEFLRPLRKLEYLIFEYVRILEKEHSSQPLADLENLKFIKMLRNTFSVEDFAFVSEALKGVRGAQLAPVELRVNFSRGNMMWTEYYPWETSVEKIDHIDMAKPIKPAVNGLADLSDFTNLTDLGIPSGKTGMFNLLGRGSRSFETTVKNARKRCLKHIKKYEDAQKNARDYLDML